MIDVSVPHSARIWNYWLGGKDNYEADRAAEEAIKEIFPDITVMARDGRAFLGRAVRYLAEHGIRQFLDLGTGLPTADNPHQVAQRVDPACRMVYVDNDPVVLAHARALLTSTPEGSTTYIDADLTRPYEVLGQLDGVLDLDRPVGVLLVSVLPHIVRSEDAALIVEQYMAAVPPGSALVLSHDTGDDDRRLVEAARVFVARGGPPVMPRAEKEVAALVEGLEVVEPGIVATWQWRPDSDTPRREKTLQYAGVAFKTGETSR